MRPVNLIPPDQRRGEQAPARAGAASYILIAVLFAILFAVTGVVLTNNDVDEKKQTLAALEQRQVEAQSRADALSEFATFQGMKDARVQTVSALAQSRFDWERVMNELSRVLPDTVWLTNLTGTVSPEVTVQKAATVTTRGQVAGPAISLIGCARSQEDVAALIAAIGDIDGVTRVLVENSEKPTSGVSASSDDGLNEDCRTRKFIAQFKLVAAFDNVLAGASAPPAPAPAPTDDGSATPASAPSSEPAASGTDPEASQAPEQTTQRQSVGKSTAKAKDAAGIIGAGDGG